MAKYEVEWTKEVWYRSTVEANSLEEARKLFWSGEYDDELDENIGTEIQDSVEITELPDA